MLVPGRRWSALILASLLTSACYESAVPIDEAPQVELDAKLLGVWRCLPFDAHATEQPATVTITRSRERVYAVSFQEADSEADLYEGYPSLLGQTTLVNLRELSRPRPSVTPWVFVRATLLRPSLLEVALVSDTALPMGLPAEVLREALTRKAGAPEVYDGFCACVRAHEGDASSPKGRAVQQGVGADKPQP